MAEKNKSKSKDKNVNLKKKNEVKVNENERTDTELEVEEVKDVVSNTKKRPGLPIKKLNLKWVLFTALLLMLGAGGYYLYKNYMLAATVNGESISRWEVLRALEDQGGDNAVESLIVRKLIRQEADRRGVEITKEEIDQEIQAIEAQYAAQGLTLDDLLSYQNMTRDSLTEQIELQKMLEKLVGSSFVISDEEVDQFIETNKASFEEVNDEVKEQVREQLRSQKQQQEIQSFIDQKKQEAEINYYFYKGTQAPVL